MQRLRRSVVSSWVRKLPSADNTPIAWLMSIAAAAVLTTALCVKHSSSQDTSWTWNFCVQAQSGNSPKILPGLLFVTKRKLSAEASSCTTLLRIPLHSRQVRRQLSAGVSMCTRGTYC